MLYAFDLDGTLFDTREIVKRCYGEWVDMPPDAFGKSWREWLVPLCNGDLERAAWIHNEKNKVYASVLAIGRPKAMKLLSLYLTLEKSDQDVWIITGASADAVAALMRPYTQKSRSRVELSREQKIQWMNSRIINGIMFEDDLEAAEQMRKETRWTVYHSPQ